MKCVKITPSNLLGKIKVPPSKSLCHRAVIAAGLSDRLVNIDNVELSDDILATCNAMRDLGIEIKELPNALSIKGFNFINSIKREIDCFDSGSTLRFIIPIALLTAEEITFKGGKSLKNRPLNPYYKIFKEQNINFKGNDGLPLTIQGMLSPGVFEVEGNVSSQFITGLLFALPLLGGDSKIIVTSELESKPYVDLTIDILKKFSVQIENKDYKEFHIKGNQKYIPINYKVEGDFSQAAFWIVAGILGEKVECEGMNLDSLQGDKAIINIVKEMGGDLLLFKDTIIARASQTRGITIDASQCPDIIPILAVLAALSKGTTRVINAQRLRIKECDRLKAIASELSKLGADITETSDGLIINGKDKLCGGTVESWNDHRIVMALSIASIKCDGPVIINNSEAVRKSYPNFFRDFDTLGGMIAESILVEEILQKSC